MCVLIMSHTRFTVNLHSVVVWMSRNALLKSGAVYEVFRKRSDWQNGWVFVWSMWFGGSYPVGVTLTLLQRLNLILFNSLPNVINYINVGSASLWKGFLNSLLLMLFSRTFILTWNFGGGRDDSTSSFFKKATASWFWCYYILIDCFIC